MRRERGNIHRHRVGSVLVVLITLEIFLSLVLVFSVIAPYADFVNAIAGENNVTVATILTIGNVAPEVLTIDVLNAEPISLTANSTTELIVFAVVRDFDGEDDVTNATMRFFDSVASSLGSAADNNNHYRNDSCNINVSYGNAFEVNATCTVFLQYYTNNATWNVTITAFDNSTTNGSESNLTGVATLLALALQDTIDYGEANTSQVTDEQIVNITNAGNIRANLSLSGYAQFIGDANAMNCTLGSIGNITIENERYNLTTFNGTGINQTQFFNQFVALNESPVVNLFNLPQRENDTDVGYGDTNETYWRIFVPVGVAGTCTGNVVFGAVQNPVT